LAVKFLEPGGDTTYTLATTNGFWANITGSPTINTDFVHGGHIKSIANAINTNNSVRTPDGTVADAGTRVSFYFYMNALPTATCNFASFSTAAPVTCHQLGVTSAGVLRLARTSSVQLAVGSTLSTGVWYRISIAYTISSTSVNRFEVFVNGVSDMSVTNATLTNIGAVRNSFGTIGADATADFRFSDIYVDDSSSLTDTGNIWVTAKRPNANGTTTGFTTQIGAGGSGYGSGHSPQVNERALSTTNGWSMVGAGSAVTEEYNIEGSSTGDLTVNTGQIIDYMGWVSTKSLVAETINIILNGASTAQAITTTITNYKVFAGSTTYPAGTGTDIGIQTDTSLTTVSLYECGVVVAYIPAVAYSISVAVGAFTLTGVSNILTKALKMATVVGAFTLTGVSVNLGRIYTLATTVGSFVLTYLPVTATFTRYVPPTHGSVNFYKQPKFYKYRGEKPR
jgi:hypothetical protein